MPLAALFIGVPLVELFLLVQVGELMGLGATIGLVFVTGLLGAALARRQGSLVLSKLRGAALSGEDLGSTLSEGAIVLVAGVLLMTPGVLTDVVGLLALIPPVRRAVAPWLAARMLARAQRQASVHVQTFMQGGAPLGGASPFGPGPFAGAQPFVGGPRAIGPESETIDVSVEVRDVPSDA